MISSVLRGVRRLAFGLAALCASILVFAAAPALAARPSEPPITEANGAPFSNPWGLAVDASDNLWVSDIVPGGAVDKFDSSKDFLEQGSGFATHGNGYTRSIAFSDASDHLYVADSFRDDLWVLNSDGSLHTDIPGSEATWGEGCCFIYTAADNSAGATGGDVYVSASRGTVTRIDGEGNPLPFTPEHSFGGSAENGIVGLATDASGHLYVADEADRAVYEFEPGGELIHEFTEANGSPFGSISAVAVDPTNGNVLIADAANHLVDEFSSSGEFLEPITEANGAPFSNPRGLAVDSAGTLYISDGTNKVVYVFGPAPPLAKPTYAPVSGLTHATVTLNANADPNGAGDITDCHFEWGTSISYGQSAQCLGSGGTPVGTLASPTDVHVDLTGLAPNTTYHYRLVLTDANGTRNGTDQSVTTLPEVPAIVTLPTGPITTTTASVGGRIDPNGSPTTYHIEYGTDANYGQSQPSTQDAPVGSDLSSHFVTQQLASLQPNTTYHYRIVATNQAGPSQGVDHTFTTLAPSLPAACPNDLARQQTGAASLPDCRAYELVSAANAGGYDVESSVVPGQNPYGSYPQASDPPRVLYAIHDGGIPGAGHPTNRGPDPYVATRGEGGWSTEYVGIPADDPSANGPFTSTLAEANGTLDTFAFAGPGICSPCFSTGIHTGIPVHTPDGGIVQGMQGSIDPGPSAEPDGYIAKYFSADGTHFVFGSTSRFEPDGNDETGDVSIYDHDLTTGVTHVVSNTPGEVPLPCLQGAGNCHSPGDANGIAELDISKEGSRIIVAQKVTTDADGNVYWHPYMDIGDSGHTVDLLPPSATHGVLFDGMTEDGSKVFFTTTDRLLPGEDTDSSADIYEAEVAENGTVTLHLISTGNSDSCEPVANEDGAHWNAVGPIANCDAVAIAGAGGIGTGDGTIYFLSPELLDGASNGTANQPNLYLSRPGSVPHFIATLDSDDPAVLDAVRATGARRYGDFQVAPSGNAAAFVSRAPLVGYDNAGHSEVYRYDALSDTLVCASCSPIAPQATGDAGLAPNGLSVTDDGRVFFSSSEPLVANDLDERKDVYEWSDGAVQLISTGTSPFDSGLLGVSADGTDAYFFTRDVLVSQDENGQAMKIYDARAGGGFFVVPPRAPCAAADECHGPGTQPPPPPSIHTVGASPGNLPPEPKQCKKEQVRKHGKCVKKQHGRSKKGRRVNRSRGDTK